MPSDRGSRWSDDAPEVSKAAEAPEIDHGSKAPEPYPFGEGLMRTPLERGSFRASGLEPAPDIRHLYGVENGLISKTSVSSSKTGRILIAVIVCAVLISVGLGAGLGIGLGNQKTSGSTSPPSTIATTPSSPSAAPNSILNDTSITAVITPDGNRHVYFQQFNGSLRHAVFLQSAGQWVVVPKVVPMLSTPRLHTPLTAITLDSTVSNETHIFYLDLNDTIAATHGEMDSTLPLLTLMNNSFLAAKGSKSMSICQLPSSNNGTTSEAIFLYEAPDGNITTLWGLFGTPVPGLDPLLKSEWIWRNISETVFTTNDGTGTWLGSPFACQYNDATFLLQMEFFNLDSISNKTASPTASVNFWSNDTADDASSGEWSVLPGLPGNVPDDITSALLQSDLLVGPMYVQNQSLVTSGSNDYGSIGSYPFKRLASSLSTVDGTLYVYHQLSDTIIAEDALYKAGVSKRTNITVVGIA